MSSDFILTPFEFEDTEAPYILGRFLEHAGYNGSLIKQTVTSQNIPPNEYHRLAASLPPDSQLNCLLRVLVLEAPTTETDLRLHLGDDVFHLCERLGIWRKTNSGIVAEASISHDGKIYLVFDYSSRLQHSQGHFVMGFSGSTTTVANAVAQRPYGRMLDVGCGGGAQSFFLSPYCKQVVGVDKNRRALNFAALGCGLNGFRNIDWRESDLFSAVVGESFDLIVCNPPFVISPAMTQEYMDGGMKADGLSERILREIPKYLREGGHARCTIDMANYADVATEHRLDQWLSGSASDLIAITMGSQSPVRYATNWLDVERPWGPQHYGKRLDDWLTYLDSESIKSVQSLLIALRKRSAGQNWQYHDPGPDSVSGAYGAQIWRMFPSLDILNESFAAPLNCAWSPPPELRLLREYRSDRPHWQELKAIAKLQEGLLYDLDLDPLILDVIERCDGHSTLQQVASSAAESAGIEWTDFMRKHWKKVRLLIYCGILVPAAVLAEEEELAGASPS